MRSIRLLPIVIFAALALLVFKGIGIATNGGYVLTGPVAVVAQEGDGDAEMTLSTPSDPTAGDTSPTLGDTAPTMPAKVDASAAGEASSQASSASAEAEATSSVASSAEATNVCPDAGGTSSESAPAGHDLTDKIGNALAQGCPAVAIPLNEHGDVLPSTKDGSGKIVPMPVAAGDESGPALVERLTERRAELDKRQADLDMREALLAAAEKKLDQRTAELKTLQDQVTALVDEKQAAEDAGFKGIVSMYETMKPREAAAIFNTLDLGVMLKVARAMNPRKMAPILAAMNPGPAQALTTALATTDAQTTVAQGGENLAALPQIVGH